MVAGYAIGGGHVLHLVCDLTIAADNALFGQTGPKVGSFDGGYGADATWRASSATRRRARSGSSAASTTRSRRSTWASSTRSCRSTELEDETVQWCREILEHSPTALRFLKAAFNADTRRPGRPPGARRRRDAALLPDRGGQGGARRLRARSASPTSRASPVGRVAVPEARQCPAAARQPGGACRLRIWLVAARARARCRRPSRRCWSARRWPRRRTSSARWRSSPRCWAASSSRSAPTSPTTTPTRAEAPTPRTASGRCA